MNPEQVDPTPTPTSVVMIPTASNKWLMRGVAALAVIGAVGSGLMWAKLSGIQEQLARQSADTGSQAVEARVTAKQAEELARETAARLAVTDAKLSEVSLQRSQQRLHTAGELGLLLRQSNGGFNIHHQVFIART